jgi:Zn finger protein HypA/HybF involved in hydrogenase expression
MEIEYNRLISEYWFEKFDCQNCHSTLKVNFEDIFLVGILKDGSLVSEIRFICPLCEEHNIIDRKIRKGTQIPTIDEWHKKNNRQLGF